MRLGGVARFMGFPGAVLTDSGGFQAMSLAKINSIDENGIRFRSHLDGAPVMLTPESAVADSAGARRRHHDGARRMHAVSGHDRARAQHRSN